MPGVNHLTYKMKGDNERSDDVTLVGYAKSEDDTRAARDERLSNPDIRAYWEKFGRENTQNVAATERPAATDGYANDGFHANEVDACRCSNSNDNDDIPPNPGFNPDRPNGNYGIPVSECSDSGSGSSWAEDTVRRCCSKKVLYKRIPVLNLYENYRKDMIFPDLVAGITVGMSMVPQAIAYASVAGLDAKYGLYSSFLGCFIYVILGSCKNSSIGPTAIQAILIRENIHGNGPSFAILLCFLTGIVQLIMGALQLGFLVDFISGPVSAGFTSAAAIVIATTQVKDLLGLKLGASDFTGVWVELSKKYQEISSGDAVLGFSCIIILFVLRKVKDIEVGSDCAKKTSLQRSMSQCLWFLSTARSILVVLTCGIIAYIYKDYLGIRPPFELSSSVEPGLPNATFPPFSATANNQTYNFFNMTSTLGSGIIIVPLLSLLESISLAKVFSEGKPVDATQELIALGACNLLSSFVGSMPMSGSLSRGAINHASEAKSTVGSMYAGAIVIASLLFLTPLFPYIPKAALAAVIISAVIFMIEFHVVKPMWRTKKIDLLPATATFLCCLLIRLEVGILIGVTINVLFLLYGSARPSVSVDKFKSEWGYEYIVITPDRSLAFPSVEYVRNVVTKAGVKQGYSSIPVVIDSRHVTGADFTVARGIKSLIEDFVQRNQLILFYNLKPSVVEIFRAVRPSEFHHCQTEHQLHNFLKDYHFRSSNGNVKLKA